MAVAWAVAVLAAVAKEVYSIERIAQLLEKARANGSDILLIDTAGRPQNSKALDFHERRISRPTSSPI